MQAETHDSPRSRPFPDRRNSEDLNGLADRDDPAADVMEIRSRDTAFLGGFLERFQYDFLVFAGINGKEKLFFVPQLHEHRVAVTGRIQPPKQKACPLGEETAVLFVDLDGEGPGLDRRSEGDDAFGFLPYDLLDRVDLRVKVLQVVQLKQRSRYVLQRAVPPDEFLVQDIGRAAGRPGFGRIGGFSRSRLKILLDQGVEIVPHRGIDLARASAEPIGNSRMRDPDRTGKTEQASAFVDRGLNGFLN